MFSFLKKRKIRKSIAKRKRQHSFRNFDSIKNILILFNINDTEEIKVIAENLRREGKNIIMWTYDPAKKGKKEQKNPIPSTIYTLNKKDISVTGNINNKKFEEFANAQYDTILDLTTKDQYPQQYLISNSKADFIIGIRETEHDLYDFILLKDNNMSIGESFRQIKKYLAKIHVRTNYL